MAVHKIVQKDQKNYGGDRAPKKSLASKGWSGKSKLEQTGAGSRNSYFLPVREIREPFQLFHMASPTRQEPLEDALLLLAASVSTPAARHACASACVPRRPDAPSPECFVCQHVRPSLPVLIENCVDHWPALRAWSHVHLRGVLGDTMVHVALTPDGLADAVSQSACLPNGEQCFARPCEVCMPFCRFVDTIERPLRDEQGRFLRPVHYASHQNSSLETEFAPLLADIEKSLPWADEAFGGLPVATNLWSEMPSRVERHTTMLS